MFLPKLLKNLGFSSNQIAIYLGLVDLKDFHKVSEIAKNANLNRTTAYAILEDFCRQGICKFEEKSQVKKFKLLGSITKNLKKYIDYKKTQIADNEKQLAKASPEFENLTPFVSFYEGIEEMKEMYLSLLKEKSNMYCFANLEEINSEMKKFLLNVFLPKRQTLKIKSNVVVSQKDFAKDKNQKSILKFATNKLLIPHEVFKFQGEIIMCNNKILFASYKSNELIGLIIQSENLNKMMRAIFDMCWQVAGEYDEFLRSIIPE